jgi:hypothetical protein
VRSWGEAIAFAHSELEGAGALEDRLDTYAGIANTLGGRIDAVERARPAVAAIERLRNVNVPLIGDGWQILLAALSVASVDGARALGRLEETLSGLVRLKDSLNGLANLSRTAAAVRAFRMRPEQSTLVALAAAATAATPSMRRAEDDVGRLLEPLGDVTSNLGGLIQGLRSAASAGIPIISDAARQAAEGIEPIEGPLGSLHERLQTLHRELGSDAGRLERIQEAVRQAKERDGG